MTETQYRIRIITLATAAALLLAGVAWLIGRAITGNETAQQPVPTPTTSQASEAATSGAPMDDDTSTPAAPNPETPRPTVWDSSINSPVPTEEPTTAAPKNGTQHADIIDPDTVDRANPDDTAAAFVDTLLTIDTGIDPRPSAAARRAATYTTGDLAKDLRTEPAGAPGHDWTTLVDRGAWTTVTTRPDSLGALPPDTKTSSTRVITATVATIDTTTADPSEDTTYILALTKTGTTWSVTRYTTTS